MAKNNHQKIVRNNSLIANLKLLTNSSHSLISYS